MRHSCPPPSLDSSVLLQALVDGERVRKAKELAEQKALAAAKTDLQRALVQFQHRLKDFYEQWGEDGPRPVLLRIYVRVEPLAEAAIQLAEAAKRAMPSQRVSEFIRLAFELNGHSRKDGSFDELSPDLRQSLKDSIIFARELEMTPEAPTEPKRKRSGKKSGHKSASDDAQAYKLAARHIQAREPWNVTSIAKELLVSRQSLDGKNARGEYRCPRFMALVQSHRHRATLTYRGTVHDLARNE
jgi:hypothetical protein